MARKTLLMLRLQIVIATTKSNVIVTHQLKAMTQGKYSGKLSAVNSYGSAIPIITHNNHPLSPPVLTIIALTLMHDEITKLRSNRHNTSTPRLTVEAN